MGYGSGQRGQRPRTRAHGSRLTVNSPRASGRRAQRQGGRLGPCLLAYAPPERRAHGLGSWAVSPSRTGPEAHCPTHLRHRIAPPSLAINPASERPEARGKRQALTVRRYSELHHRSTEPASPVPDRFNASPHRRSSSSGRQASNKRTSSVSLFKSISFSTPTVTVAPSLSPPRHTCPPIVCLSPFSPPSSLSF